MKGITERTKNQKKRKDRDKNIGRQSNKNREILRSHDRAP
jgi:hypothetical protein